MKTRGIVFEGTASLAEPPASLPDISRWGNDGTFVGTDMQWVQLSSGLWVLEFNGIDDYVDIGDTDRLVQSVTLWLHPDDNTTRAFMDLDGGTHSLELDGSGDLTATGWAAPTFYVNAVAAAVAVTQSAWSFLAVTTATAFEASDLDIGREATWYEGQLALVRLHNYVLSAGDVNKRYAATRKLFGV